MVVEKIRAGSGAGAGLAAAVHPAQSACTQSFLCDQKVLKEGGWLMGWF